MKIPSQRTFQLLIILVCFIGPAAAGMVGNASTVNNPGQITSVITGTYATPAPTITAVTISLPAIPQFALMIVGILIILAAISGLLWRYFHPKYVAPEENE